MFDYIIYMSSSMDLNDSEKQLKHIISRNLIFPDDQAKLIDLIKNGKLTKDAKTGMLHILESRNLIFPEDISSLKKLVSEQTYQLGQQQLPTEANMTPADVLSTKKLLQDINTGDESFKTLMELLIAAASTSINYGQDPIQYTKKLNVLNSTIHIKENSQQYKHIVQTDLLFGMPDKLLRDLCVISSFKEKNPGQYAIRVYFNSVILQKGLQPKLQANKIPEFTDLINNNQEPTIFQKTALKISKCGREYLDKFNSIFQERKISDIAYGILSVLNKLPYVEIVKVELGGNDKLSQVIEQVNSSEPRIINVDQRMKEGKYGDFFGFLKSLVGGGNDESDYDDYEEMKKKYKYTKASMLHQLLKY